MDWNTTWSLIGYLFAIIVGMFTIYLALRLAYPGRITFVREKTINLLQDVAHSVPGLTATFFDNPVERNLVLLNGALINTGKTDISLDMVEKPIQLTLPNGYKLLAARITHASDHLQAELAIDENGNAVFDLGLFRKKEYVRFHVLVEVPSSQEEESPISALSSAISFSHRIKNTRKVEKTRIARESLVRFGLPALSIMIALSLLIILSSFGALIAMEYWKTDILAYEYALDKDAPLTTVVARVDGEDISISDTSQQREKTVSLQDFQNNMKNVVIVPQPMNLVEYSGAVALMALGLIYLSVFLTLWYRDRRIGNILGIDRIKKDIGDRED